MIYMTTTIQVQDQTLKLLRKIKSEIKTSSYDETINKLASRSEKRESMAGYLGRYFEGKSLKKILAGLRDEHDRF